MWHSIHLISAVPADRDLRLAVINADGVHALVFPCRRKDGQWADARTARIIEVAPTHWQAWSDESELGTAGRDAI